MKIKLTERENKAWVSHGGDHHENL